MGGWCNGTAGHLQLWAAAARLVQKTRYVEVANRTAAEVLRSARLDPNPFLCCGASGAAYALLALSESTNKQVLVDGAFLLAEQAAQQVMLPQFPAMSLYRGPLGVAVLASDLRRSTAASMPMFGPEHPR